MTDIEIIAIRRLLQGSGVCADDFHDSDVQGIPNATMPILTGSRVYGIPRDDSDIDLVLLVDPDTSDVLWEEAQGGKVSVPKSVRFGILNLILETSPAKFAAWKEGTEYLSSIGAVTRDVAVEHFKSLFAKIKPQASQ